MALDSDKVRQSLKIKLGCEEITGRDRYWYNLKDQTGMLISRTKVSLGPKHSIGNTIISKMAHQLRLGTASNFVGMVTCTRQEKIASPSLSRTVPAEELLPAQPESSSSFPTS